MQHITLKRILALALAALMVAPVMAACGSGDGGNDTKAPSKNASTSCRVISPPR